MRNIADEFFILLVIAYFFFRIILQTLTHFLKVFTKLTNFILILYMNFKIQIAILDILSCHLQHVNRGYNTVINPKHQTDDNGWNYQTNEYHQIGNIFSDIYDKKFYRLRNFRRSGSLDLK